MKSVLIICYSDLNRDPRVLRQIDALHGVCRLTTAGLSHSKRTGTKHIDLSRPGADSFITYRLKIIFSLLGLSTLVYWDKRKREDLKKLAVDRYDWIVSNDLAALPISLRLARINSSNTIFDAHEYFPGTLQFGGIKKLIFQRLLLRSCKKYMPQVDYLTVVSPEIQKLYKLNFGIESTLITNATNYTILTPKKVEQDKIHLVHHGSAAPARKIELMIEMLKHLDERFILHFYLLKSEGFVEYYDYLVTESKEMSERIVFHNLVPTDQIPEEINKYDIGIFLLPPTNINYELALPNKFFEFVQGRLAIAIGPSIEMAKYVKKYKLGIVASDFKPKTLAIELSNLNVSQIQNYKNNSNRYARELSSEQNLKYYSDLILSK